MIEEVSLENEVQLGLPAHEILLSFNNDSGAEKFEEWWFIHGQNQFDKYCTSEDI